MSTAAKTLFFFPKKKKNVKSIGHFQIALTSGGFSFNKNSGLKFWKFYVPNGTAHSGCTDSTQATVRLVIVLVSRIQKRVMGTTILSNGRAHFGPTDRDNRTSQSGPPSKLVPNIVVRPNRNDPFHLMYQPLFN